LFLKRLEISGFKSFASKSILDFDKNESVAAIVGPNGSGKSNVADSIRWVLGETSYKTIRSKKSEDVIFSGSNGKAKSSMARVSMVLDNTDGKAPIDFSEVEIARGVYRDGTSEYLINGRKSRLLDVAELLAKSGFGQSTYSVIGQGMVDSMLFYGPAERKVLFDEAAGVRQYELKREQTLKKLSDTSSNIVRVRDILSELTPRLGTLKKQSEKAKEKDSLKSALLQKQKVYFASLWDRYNTWEKDKKKELGKVLKEEEALNAEINVLNEKFNQILSNEDQKSSEAKEVQTKIAELEAKKDEKRQRIFTLRAKMELTASALTKKEIAHKIKEAEEILASYDLGAAAKQKKALEKSLMDVGESDNLQKIRGLELKKDSSREEIYRLKAELNQKRDGLPAEVITKNLKEQEAILSSLTSGQSIKEKKAIAASLANCNNRIIDFDKQLQAKKSELGDLTRQLKSFDFGVVNERVSDILELQDNFISRVGAAGNIKEVKLAILAAKEVSTKLKELKNQVGDVKAGRISGMSDIQETIESILTERESLAAEKSQLESSLWKLDFEIKNNEQQAERVRAEISKFKKMQPLDEKKVEKIENQISSILKEIEKYDSDILLVKNDNARAQDIRNQIMTIDFEIRRINEKRSEQELEIKRLSDLAPASDGEKHKIELEIANCQKEVDSFEGSIAALKREIDEKNALYAKKSQMLSEIKDKLYQQQNLLGKYGNESTMLKIEVAKIDTKKQDLKEEIAREIGSEAILVGVSAQTELDEESVRREIDRLKNKLYAIGEIDPEVNAEYEEVNSRVNFLDTQTQDLEKAKTDLEKLISELDVKIKKQFEASFTAISERFSYFFNLLFNGGTSKLELVRSKDEGEETEKFGIEISAVPPGKRVNSLSALSGGERTLTSLALLFAILSVNPAPFCVLDEVDAALDETNTKKFLKIVEELSQKTQFIFISHNRETMKVANIIYGITMDETHASKLLSIKLEDALTAKNDKKH
jgi:chromosome segregation protein